jgi:cytochrome c556
MKAVERRVFAMSGQKERRWRRAAAMIGMVGLCAGALGPIAWGAAAWGQERGVTPPKETIFARKILMDSISQNMDELEANASSPKVDLAEGRSHADIVSVMLMAFPHLFPQTTNEWKPNVDRDPGSDTYAAPEIWAHFADFYKRTHDAAQIAFKASRAETEQAFKDQVAQLRVACDSCHGVYLKKD